MAHVLRAVPSQGIVFSSFVVLYVLLSVLLLSAA